MSFNTQLKHWKRALVRICGSTQQEGCVVLFYLVLLYVVLYISHISTSFICFAGKSMSPQVMFHKMTSNINCKVLFATRHEYDDDRIKVIVQCFTKANKIFNGPWAMVSQSTFTRQ